MPSSSRDQVREIVISREPIELYQLLKLAELAASGGEAKFAIAGGRVRVNGEVEQRKRRKVMAGDLVEFAGARLRVVAPRPGGGGAEGCNPPPAL